MRWEIRGGARIAVGIITVCLPLAGHKIEPVLLVVYVCVLTTVLTAFEV